MTGHLSHPEKEAAVIGYISGAGIGEVADPASTRPEHFTNPLASVVWEAVLYLHRKGRNANALDLMAVIEADRMLSRIATQAAQDHGIPDLLSYFAGLDSSLTYIPGGGEIVGEHLRDISEAAGRRKAAGIGKRLAEGGIEAEDAVEELVAIRATASKPPLFADFKKILDGGFQREMPSVCEAMQGKFLLYAGRINELHGESGIGKSNINLTLASRIMRAGRSVLFLDPEDNPQGIAQRFISLGGNPEDLIHRFRYVHNPEPGDYPGLIEWAKRHKPAAVFLDGLAEALIAEGYDENSVEVLTFLRQRIRPFADAGAAVVIADHVAKNKETRGRNPRGSGAKLGRFDGAVYSVDLIKPYSPTTAGAVRLTISKDRNGGVGHVGQRICELHFSPGEDGRTETYFTSSNENGKPFLPTALMEKVSKFVESQDLVPSKHAIEVAVEGKATYVRQAIDALVEHGFIKADQRERSTQISSVKPFREREFREAA